MKLPDRDYLVLLSQMSASVMAGCCHDVPDYAHIMQEAPQEARACVDEAKCVLTLLNIEPTTPLPALVPALNEAIA